MLNFNALPPEKSNYWLFSKLEKIQLLKAFVKTKNKLAIYTNNNLFLSIVLEVDEKNNIFYIDVNNNLLKDHFLNKSNYIVSGLLNNIEIVFEI